MMSDLRLGAASAVRQSRLWQRHAAMARIGAIPGGGVNRLPDRTPIAGMVVGGGGNEQPAPVCMFRKRGAHRLRAAPPAR